MADPLFLQDYAAIEARMIAHYMSYATQWEFIMILHRRDLRNAFFKSETHDIWLKQCCEDGDCHVIYVRANKKQNIVDYIHSMGAVTGLPQSEVDELISLITEVKCQNEGTPTGRG